MGYTMLKYINYLFCCLRLFYSTIIILLNLNKLSPNLIINICTVPLIFLVFLGLYIKNHKLIFLYIIGTWLHLLFLIFVFISVPLYLLFELYNSQNNLTVLKMKEIKIALAFWFFVACNILFFIYSILLSTKIYKLFYKIKLIKQKNLEIMKINRIDVV